jgi:hypothetical protein
MEGLMKLPASHSSPFVGKRHKPHHGTAFSSALEHLNPTALYSPRQGFYLLIEVTQLPRFHCLTDGGEVKVIDKVTSSDVDPVGVTARFALVADLRMPWHGTVLAVDWFRQRRDGQLLTAGQVQPSQPSARTPRTPAR